jgi:hypothetical protein
VMIDVDSDEVHCDACGGRGEIDPDPPEPDSDDQRECRRELLMWDYGWD